MYQKKGFTLIELLVVIAIIAILLSVLIPALGKAKMFAEEIVCKSNLHQYHIATEIFCNDNDSKLPPAYASLYSQGDAFTADGEINSYCRWHNPLFSPQSNAKFAGPYWPYLAATKANVCPTFARMAPTYGAAHLENIAYAPSYTCIGAPYEPQFGYGMNYYLSPDGNTRKNQIKNPSHTFLWAEENMWTLKNMAGTIDLSRQVLNDNALMISPTPVWDNFASYHKIGKNKLNVQRSDHRYESGSGVANVLLVDGSLEWLTPEQGLEYVGNN